MKERLLIALICITAVTCVFSQESVQTLTFEEAVKIGLKNNVNLNTQKNNLFVNESRKLQSYAGYLPNISAQAFAQRTDGLQIDPTTGAANNISSDVIQGSVNASYTLFNGFNRLNTLKQNNSQFIAQTYLVKRANQDVIFNVASQYLQVLLDQELLRIAEENTQAQKVILEQIKALVSLGTRAQADEFNQDAIVKNLEVTALRAKATLENDRALLAQIIQLDPQVPYQLQYPNLNLELADYSNLSMDSLFTVAAKNRPDLIQQKYQVDALQRSMKASSSGYIPTIIFFAGYGSTYFVRSDLQQSESFQSQFFDLNPQLNYGINLRIPIFDQFLTRTNRSIAKINYENSRLTEDDLFKSVKIDVQRAYNNYKNAIESYQASLAQYEAGELAIRTQRESYELGVSSQIELAQANQTFTQALASRAQAEVTLVFQQVLLEYALGTLYFEETP
jgi:outer membrane protein